jgi:YfiH family protein
MIKGDASPNAPKNGDRTRTHPVTRQLRLPPARGVVKMLPAPDPVFHWTSEPWGDALRCRRLGADAQHLFTSKQLALPATDAWRAALDSVGSAPDRLMRVEQVHGNAVRILRRGEVPEGAADVRPDADAIVSNQPGLALAVMVADCVPILLVDRKAGAAAAIHAGWRGTCAGVVSAAIAAMQREFGTDPGGLTAAIGPSVGPQDYEVGESLVDAFLAAGHAQANVDRWFIRSGPRPHLNLWAANVYQLLSAGVDARQIFLCGLSTVSHPDIFDSYRVAGERAGRMAAVIVVPAPA